MSEGLPDGKVRHIGEEPVVVKDDDRVGAFERASRPSSARRRRAFSTWKG
jgi:hypothetical protein